MRNRTRQLFGGALRCAGMAVAMTTSSAIADFAPAADPGGIPNYTFGYVDNTSFESVFFWSSTSDAGEFANSMHFEDAGGANSAYADSAHIGVKLVVEPVTDWWWATARVAQFFTVDREQQVRLEWQFDEFEGYGDLRQVGVGNIVFVNEASGALTLTLSPDEIYVFFGVIQAKFITGGEDFFVRLSTVPSPGALAILGMGMLGTRRRRRE